LKRLLAFLLIIGLCLSPVTALAENEGEVRVDEVIIAAEHVALRQAEDGRIKAVHMVQFAVPEGVEQVIIDPLAGFQDPSFPADLTEYVLEIRSEDILIKVPHAGMWPVAFSYYLNREDLEQGVSKKVTYRTMALDLLIETVTGLELIEGGFTHVGEMTISDRSYADYRAQELSAGQVLTLRFTSDDVITTSFHGGTANVKLWMRLTGRPDHAGLAGVLIFALIVVVVVWVGVAVYRNRRRARLEQAREQVREKVKALTAKRDALMSELLELEKKREAGELGDEDYRRLREELRAKLVDVTVELKKIEGEGR